MNIEALFTDIQEMTPFYVVIFFLKITFAYSKKAIVQVITFAYSKNLASSPKNYIF